MTWGSIRVISFHLDKWSTWASWLGVVSQWCAILGGSASGSSFLWCIVCTCFIGRHDFESSVVWCKLLGCGHYRYSRRSDHLFEVEMMIYCESGLSCSGLVLQIVQLCSHRFKLIFWLKVIQVVRWLQVWHCCSRWWVRWCLVRVRGCVGCRSYILSVLVGWVGALNYGVSRTRNWFEAAPIQVRRLLNWFAFWFAVVSFSINSTII